MRTYIYAYIYIHSIDQSVGGKTRGLKKGQADDLPLGMSGSAR